MKKNKTKLTVQAKQMIAEIFTGMGGSEKFIAWARNHPETFYTSLYVKLLPYQIAEKVEHSAADDTIDQEKFERALAGVIEARAHHVIEQHAGVKHTFSGGPDIDREIRESDRKERQLREAMAEPSVDAPPPEVQRAMERDYCRIIDEPPKQTKQPDTNKPNTKQPEAVIIPPARPARSSTPSIPGLCAGAAVGEGADDNLSTTERYLLWNGRDRMP